METIFRKRGVAIAATKIAGGQKGEVPDEWTADFIRNSITERFQAAGVNLSALFCALVGDYAGQGEKVDRQAILAAALRNFGRQRR